MGATRTREFQGSPVSLSQHGWEKKHFVTHLMYVIYLKTKSHDKNYFWKGKIDINDKTSHGPFSLNWLSTVESAKPTPEWAELIQCKSGGSCTAIMLFNSYTSVSRLINTEPSELLRLRLSEPIASESVWHIVCGQTCDGLYHFVFYLINFGIPYGSRTIKPDYTQKSTTPILALKLSVSAIITPGGLPQHIFFLLLLIEINLDLLCRLLQEVHRACYVKLSGATVIFSEFSDRRGLLKENMPNRPVEIAF